MIMFCTCNHSYQDKQYGAQMRSFNKTKKKVADKYQYRCTVCGTEKTK